MSIITLKRGANQQLTTHFNSNEFECKCGACKSVIIDQVLPEKLELLRNLLGSPIKITSGYRCKDYQQQLRIRGYDTAKGISQHELGKAADITDGVTPGHELEEFAKKAGFMAIGVGKHFLHLDLRSDKGRIWYYNY